MALLKVSPTSFWSLFGRTDVCGWLLLARPVLYFMFSRRRELDQYSAIDFSAFIFIAYAFICFFVSARQVMRPNSFGRKVMGNSPILLLLIYTLLSAISMVWSVIPVLTGFRAFECLAMIMLLIGVMQSLVCRYGLRVMIAWSIFYVTWDIIWAIIRNVVAWGGFHLEYVLEASQMSATCFFFLAFYFARREWFGWLIMVMSIFSMSTVAYIGMALGSIGLLWTTGKKKVFIVFGTIFFAMAVVVIGPRTFLKNTLFFDKTDISLDDTSGRDALMRVAIESLEENPMGLGFFAAEPYILYKHFVGAISAHNSIFSAAMGMGWPGVIVIGLFFIVLGLTAFAPSIPRKLRPAMIGCFFVAFLHCMGNPSVGTRVYGAWMPCAYIFIMISSVYVASRYYKLKF